MRIQGLIRLIAAFTLLFAVPILHAATLEQFPLLPPSASVAGNCGPQPRCFAVLGDLRPDTAVVGAPGQVSIFERQTTGEWQLTSELLDPFAPLPRPYYNSRFGYLASLDGALLAVAATPEDRPSPVIYLFTREQGQWSLLQSINFPRSFGDVYLSKILLRDGTLAVSQIEYATDSSGDTETKALVFSRNSGRGAKGGDGSFQLQQQLDPASNPDPDAAYSIDMEAGTLVLATSSNGDSAGAVYLYRKPGGKAGAAKRHSHSGQWRLSQVIRQPVGASGFASAISLSGNMLAIGAPGEVSPPPTLFPGVVYIYRQEGARWRVHDRIVDPVTETDPPCEICLPPSEHPFGTMLALSGNRLLVMHFIAADRGFGLGIVFEQQSEGWTPVATIGDLSMNGSIIIQSMLLNGATAWLAETPMDVFSPGLNLYDLPALTSIQHSRHLSHSFGSSFMAWHTRYIPTPTSQAMP